MSTTTATSGTTPAERAIHPDTRIGHVHLKVSDLPRAIAFYRDVLGFELMEMYGDQAAFLSAGGYHHHIGLNTWESRGGPPPPRGTTGLYHVAILYPNRTELARALKRLVDHGVPIDGASDHGVSEAIYLHDPDGNGIEIYRDRPREEWPIDEDGSLRMVTDRLDLRGLLRELDD
jgi:catechol 2,3-dioxygenase